MVFNIQECPNAYFSDNPAACKLRSTFKYPEKIHTNDFNKLKKIFLSKQNIDSINIKLQEITLKEMNVKIPLQKSLQIYIIANYIFNKEASNQTFYDKEIKYLNQLLIDYIKSKLFITIKHKLAHLKDLENENKIKCLLPLPISVSKSNKSLESLSNKIIFKY